MLIVELIIIAFVFFMGFGIGLKFNSQETDWYRQQQKEVKDMQDKLDYIDMLQDLLEMKQEDRKFVRGCILIKHDVKKLHGKWICLTCKEKQL